MMLTNLGGRRLAPSHYLTSGTKDLQMHYGLLSSKTILDLVLFLYHILTKKMGAAGRHTAYMGWKGIVF